MNDNVARNEEISQDPRPQPKHKSQLKAETFLSGYFGADALFQSVAFELRSNPPRFKPIRQRYLQLCIDLLDELRRARDEAEQVA